jgi:Mn2+/Fe2+ NRAMP family transporter
VVFGPGSLVVSSNIGATYGYELLWLLVVTGVLMGTFVTMGARIGVVGGATPCTLVAGVLGRWAAAIIGINLCLICSAFQFSNNVALALAVRSIVPGLGPEVILVAVNGLIITFLFTSRHVYHALERIMKVMVGVILFSFVLNLFVAQPALRRVLAGFIPGLPEGVLGVPKRVGNAIEDPMLLIASLLGTTFSVGAAFFQGNLVREKGWTIREYTRGIGDAIAGVSVLAVVSLVIMITTATVIPGRPAVGDIGELAGALRPLLGSGAYYIFCAGLVAVAMNPFLINAMIGGTILADGVGLPARLSDRWPRIFTVAVMLGGMVVALWALRRGTRPVELIIFGQALTVLGNPLMAATMLGLANRRDVMGGRRNSLVLNLLGGAGLVVVLLGALRVLWMLSLKLGG